MRGEKLIVGALTSKGWVIESASGEREEAMSVWAAAVSALVGARSMSALAGQFCCEARQGTMITG